jgi:hypothetical protein
MQATKIEGTNTHFAVGSPTSKPKVLELATHTHTHTPQLSASSLINTHTHTHILVRGGGRDAQHFAQILGEGFFVG